MNLLVSHLTSELWAMERNSLAEFLAAVLRVDISAVRPDDANRTATPFVKEGDTAKIAIKGPILRSAIPILRRFGLDHVGADEIRDQLAAAALDQSIRSIALDIDSPGGVASAGKDIAEDVYAARSLGKRVTATTSGMAASAAYWIAAQAEQITASPAAIVGAIGVYTSIVDASKAADAAGVKVHVVSSHELKGVGVMGAPVTENQLADLQRNIDTMARMFESDIERGRGSKIPDVTKLATGSVWIGGEARLNGLVDSISGSQITKQSQQISTAPMRAVKQESTMTPEEIAAQAAENARLKAELETHKAQAKAMEHASKIALLDKHADRVMPAARPAFEKLAEHMDLAGFEAHILALPAFTRPAISKELPVVSDAARRLAGNGLASLTGYDPFTREPVGGQAGAEQVAKLLGTSVDAIDKYADVECGYSNGTFKMRDGRVVTATELKKMKAA